MMRRWTAGVFAAAVMVALLLPGASLAVHDGNPDLVDDCDSCWKAPDVTVSFSSDFLQNQSSQAGPTFEVTIDEFWQDGHCYYDSTKNFEPNTDCDRLRFGLAMYRGPDDAGFCPDPLAAAVAPQEDGGDLLTSGNYKVSALQTKAGDAYCSEIDQRTLGESLLAYRDHRLAELGTQRPDRPQLMLNVIKEMPQSADGADDHVRDSLLAACELYEGDGNRHMSIPTWMMTTKGSSADVDLFAGMMAAAGGTGQCCYDPTVSSCDPTDTTSSFFIDDMCAHLSNGTLHTEAKLRSDITNARYQCTGTPKLTAPGNMGTDEFSQVKCQLNGSSCDQDDDPALLWPIFSCIQVRPNHIPPGDLAVEYCGSIDGEPIDADDGDENGNGCITLTPGNGIEWVDDEQKNLFYLSADSYSFPDANGNVSGTRVQSAIGSGNTASATFSTDPIEGNLLVAMSAHRVDWTTPEMLNSGWTEVTSIVDQDSDNNRRRGLAIWYKIATASEPNTVETTWSGGSVGSSRHNTLLIQEFAGDYTLDVSTTHSSGSNAVNSLSTGTTAAAADSSALIIGAKAMREVGDAASWTNGFGSNIRVLSTDHGAPSPTTLQTAHRTSTTSQQWETTASWGGGAGEAVSAIVVFSDSGGQPNIDDESLCRGIAAGDSWTNVLCASEGQLCDLNDGSSCTVGRYVCQNNVQICERFPGNDDTCDSAACAGETVHETGLVQPNVQFLVDRSGSMNSGSLWHDTRELIKSLADWSYQGAGCDEGDTNCDYARLGVHFWSGNDPRGGPDEVERISPGEDTTASDVDGAFSIGPDGGTEFHQAARLTKNEVALDDPDRPNTAIFVTDGVPENAFTTAEAVREFCDLRKRANAPVATHAVGFYGGNINITSLIGAAGGTATCCFSTDGDCEGKTSVSPCQLYENELTNGADIVNTFETWLQNEQPSHYTEWIDLNDRIARHAHTEDAYRRGTVADDLDMINDVARWMLNKDAGINPDTIDCSSDSGDQTSSNPAEFYKWALCATEQTLSHVISHRYDNSLAKDVSGWSDFNYVYTENHDSTFLANDYTCTGAMFQSDPSDLYDGLHALMSGMECSYPLTLLDGHDSAPEFTDATYVRLYIPELGTVVRVPHTDDSSGQQAFKDELCAMGIPNCEDYATSGWEFSNSGRTSVQLTDELCDFTKSDAVERVTTQVCLTCDPDELGQPCEWVACNPDPSTIDDDTAYTSDGQFCRWVEHPCPDDPNSMCNSWAKTGRCGLGEYACDDNGRPTCVQVHSAMPEICNGIDDSCDGQIDNMSDNPTHPEWSQSQYDITDEPYDGWYCNYRDTCACPGGNPDSIGGYADDPDEFTSMMEHQQANGQCQCGEALSSAGPTNLEPTRSGPESTTGQPQATCSSTGDAGPHSLLTVALGLLLGVIGLRRRKR